MSQPWHSKEDFPHRVEILNAIRDFFLSSSEVSRTELWGDTFPSFMRRLELVLYLCGSSLEEYANVDTVVERLWSVAKHLSVQREEQLGRAPREESPAQDAVAQQNFRLHLPASQTSCTGQGIVHTTGPPLSALSEDRHTQQQVIIRHLGGPDFPELHAARVELPEQVPPRGGGLAPPESFVVQDQEGKGQQVVMQTTSGHFVSVEEGLHRMPLATQEREAAGAMGRLAVSGYLRVNPEPGQVQGGQNTHLLAESLAPDMWQTAGVDNGAGPPSGTAGLTVNESGLMPAVSVGALQPALSPEYVELLTTYGRENGSRE